MKTGWLSGMTGLSVDLAVGSYPHKCVSIRG